MSRISILLLSVLFLVSSCKKDKDGACAADLQPVNQLQYIGSHNSYRIKTYQPIFDLVITLSNTGVIPADLDPNEWDYDHVGLIEQIEAYNVRSFEIDIYHDPEGGRFYNRQGNVFVGESAESGIPELLEPGYKVIHIPDLDYNTHHYTFKDAMRTLRDWSAQNPNHEPIFVMLELKDQAGGDLAPGLGFVTALPYDAQAMQDLENEVREVYGNDLDGVYTPDMLRGDYATVKEAALNGSWPKLAEARGHVFYILDVNDEGESHYLAAHPNLEGASMFVFSNEGNPETAFIKRDDPNASDIRTLVESGYFVRTRADAGTTEARTGDTSRRDAAFASGAQMISTDYYRADPRHPNSEEWTDYEVQFESRKAYQLNTVNNDCE